MSAAPGPVPPDAIAEMLRQAERVVDDQVKTFERADTKSERLVALAVGVAAGGVGIYFQLATAAGATHDLAGLAIAGAGTTVAMSAVWCFLRASLGMLRLSEIRIGPSPDWMLRALNLRPLTNPDVQLTALGFIAECYLENLAKLHESLELRVRGVKRMAASVALFGVAMLYIAGR